MTTNTQQSKELSRDDLATLPTVLRELNSVQEKWYNIGFCLGLHRITLGGIQNDDNKTSEECLRAMLSLRINHGGLTWELIAKALEDVTVDRTAVAKEIRAKYCPLPLLRASATTSGVRKKQQNKSTAEPVAKVIIIFMEIMVSHNA